MKLHHVVALVVVLLVSGSYYFFGVYKKSEGASALFEMIPSHTSLMVLDSGVKKVQDLTSFLPAMEVYSDSVSDAAKFFLESQKQGFINDNPICSLEFDDLEHVQNKWSEARNFGKSLTEKLVQQMNKKMESIKTLSAEELDLLSARIKVVKSLQLRVNRSSENLLSASKELDLALDIVSKALGHCKLLENF